MREGNNPREFSSSSMHSHNKKKTVVDKKSQEIWSIKGFYRNVHNFDDFGGRKEILKSHSVSLIIGTPLERRSKSPHKPKRLSRKDSHLRKSSKTIFSEKPSESQWHLLGKYKTTWEHQSTCCRSWLLPWNELLTGYATKSQSGLHIAKTVYGPLRQRFDQWWSGWTCQ